MGIRITSHRKWFGTLTINRTNVKWFVKYLALIKEADGRISVESDSKDLIIDTFIGAIEIVRFTIDREYIIDPLVWTIKDEKLMLAKILTDMYMYKQRLQIIKLAKKVNNGKRAS